MLPSLSRKERLTLISQEIASYYKFFRQFDKRLREIVFYSSQSQYISFYEGLLNALGKRGAQICYITSDHTDPMLINHPPNILPIYFNMLFPFVLPFLDAKVVVMTMPDLQRYHIRRSIYETNHVYLFHSLMSTHMGFRKGALDHFDTIFCAGPHHVDEIRRTERLYNLRPKCLLEVGYYRLEKIHRDHKNYKEESSSESRTTPNIIIAPSGHEKNIVSTCASELVSGLLNADFKVVFRPHPMTIYRRPGQLAALIHEFGTHMNFQMDLETKSETFLHRADVLISDWSGVALEYAFGTERPVLFIDLPRRQQNPEYQKIGISPVEVILRDKIGKVVSVEEIPQIERIIKDLIQVREEYCERIKSYRSGIVFNFGNSSDIGADYILKLSDGEACGSVN